MEKDPQEPSQLKEGQKISSEELEKKFFKRLQEFYNEYFLSDLQKLAVTKFIKSNLGRKDNHQVDRARGWLIGKINKKFIKPQEEMQFGCPDIVPGLRAKPWWDASEFPWMKHFEDNYEIIRDELLSLRNQKGFQPYRGPSWISELKPKDGIGRQSVDSGTWNVFYLELHNLKFDTNCEKVPKTMELINEHIPNNYHHAFISALTTKSHIMKHHGPTNKKLRFHLPLTGVSGSRMRVANETRQQVAGKAYVFDDSFEHEAWHDGDETRLILIVDFWHPDITMPELKFFKVLLSAIFKAEQAFAEMDPEKDNFYSIIESAKDIIKDNDWWVVNEGEKGKEAKEEAKEDKQLEQKNEVPVAETN